MVTPLSFLLFSQNFLTAVQNILKGSSISVNTSNIPVSGLHIV